MAPLNTFLHVIASFVCHQDHLRTIHVGGLPLPLCARCSGIYAGFLVAFLFAALCAGKKGRRLPSGPVALTSIFFFLIFVAEGVSARLKLWPSINLIRFSSGLLGGSTMGLLSLPLLNHFIIKKGEGRDDVPLTSGKYALLLLLLGFLVLACTAINHPVTLYFCSYLSVAGLLFAYLAVNTTLAAMVLGFNPKKKNVPAVANLLLFTILLLASEISLLSFFRK